MARKTEYDKAVNKEEKLNKGTILRENLNKEDIGTAEMAVVVGVDDRSVRNMIIKLCEEHKELNLESFKAGKSYKFKAVWNGLLATILMISSDGRREQSSLESYLEDLDLLKNGVETYLDSNDQAIVKSHSTYMQAELEEDLYDAISKQLGQLANQIGMMPSSMKFQTLAGVHELLKPIPSHMAQSHASYVLETLLYKHEMKEKDNASINETSFKEGLKEYLVSLLALRMQGEDKVEESYSMDMVGSTLTEMFMLGQLTDTEKDGIASVVQGNNEKIFETDRIKPILEKVQNVLDSGDPIEQMVLEWIKKTLVLISVSSTNQDVNKDIGREILRQSVVSQVQQILE